MKNQMHYQFRLRTLPRKKATPRSLNSTASIDALRNGGHISDIARKYGLNANLLYLWRDQLIKRGSQVFKTTPDQTAQELY